MTDMGRDTKIYPLCNPYHGEEGAKWSRVFKPDLISGLGTVTDKYSSIAKHIVARDVGGIQPFAPRLLDPAAPGPNAGALVGCAMIVHSTGVEPCLASPVRVTCGLCVRALPIV